MQRIKKKTKRNKTILNPVNLLYPSKSSFKLKEIYMKRAKLLLILILPIIIFGQAFRNYPQNAAEFKQYRQTQFSPLRQAQHTASGRCREATEGLSWEASITETPQYHRNITYTNPEECQIRVTDDTTYVSGGTLYGDVHWTKENSPYL